MNVRMCLLGWAGLCCALPAVAAPYWVAYEGNDYPENEGWERVYGNENGPQEGGSERSLVDGVLELDSRRNHSMYDSYFWRQPLNPHPGESFTAEWRVLILENTGPAGDSGFTIARDGGGTLAFQFGKDFMRSSREQWQIAFTADVYHTFRLLSSDMVTYSLWVDGHHVRDGTWDLNSLNESYLAFGDAVSGGAITSRARWDFVRFGTVPEPGIAGLTLLVLGTSRRIMR